MTNMDPNDFITALKNQRNGALDEAVQLYAMLQEAKREIAALKEKYEKPETAP